MDTPSAKLTKWGWFRLICQAAMSVLFFSHAMQAQETFDRNFKFVGSAVFALNVAVTLIDRRIRW